jgi:hypothetical protein
MTSSRLLAAVVVLQGLILASLWTKGPVTPAHAQIPDAGGQRAMMIDELKKMNDKMDKMSDLLRSGEVQVRIPKADDKK